MPFVAVFAGPNGSGKSSLFRRFEQQNINVGTYINPDEIAKTLVGTYADRSREAQAIADRIREECLDRGQNFSFETVMSHPSKVDFIEKATLRGYESVLYFVSTADPEINVVRVAERVEQGGHDVPRDRIIDRYYRSVKLLPFAVHHSRQAYIFDNTRDGDYALFLGLQKSTETSGKANYTLFPGAPSWIESLYKELL